jgi:chromosome segregation ATPase
MSTKHTLLVTLVAIALGAVLSLLLLVVFTNIFPVYKETQPSNSGAYKQAYNEDINIIASELLILQYKNSQLKNELETKKLNSQNQYYDYSSRKCHDLEDEEDNIEDELEDIEDEIDELEAEIAIRRMQNQTTSDLEDDLKDLKDERDDLEDELDDIEDAQDDFKCHKHTYMYTMNYWNYYSED